MSRFTPYSARYPKGKVLQPNDHPAMLEAIRTLSSEHIAFRRVSPHQIKLSPTLSFYPATGTIMHDRQKPLPQRGLVALLALLRKAPQTITAPTLLSASAETALPIGLTDEITSPWDD